MNNQDGSFSTTLQIIHNKLVNLQAALDIDGSQPATVIRPTLPNEKAMVDRDILTIRDLARSRTDYRTRLVNMMESLKEEADLMSQSMNDSREKLSEHVGEPIHELVLQTRLLQVTTTSIRKTLIDLTTRVEQIGSDVSSCDRRLQKMDNEPQKDSELQNKDNELQNKDNGPRGKSSNPQKKDTDSKKMDADQEKKTLGKLGLVLNRIILLKSILFAGSSEKYFKEPKDLSKCASTMDEDILLTWCRAPTKEAYRAGLCDLYERLRQEKNELKESLGMEDNYSDSSSSNSVQF
ncbi:hypothetical protein BG011_010217 [Mortierella polycephala]|uniref:Uncharacterized protein n=1 Tax=Mortierella polycephala TaxID=41804 RepID=A0A9P6TVM4_9FUNG|nr:hypothetical protein BG011_010217 [Mortierella polycephala]